MYLEQRAEEDALFAKKYRNPAKNMDECVTHILNYVQKSGCNGFTDGEIFGQAIHYYEENEIEVGKPMDCQVVVNHVVKLTAEEKAEARQNAVRKYQEEELRKLQNRPDILPHARCNYFSRYIYGQAYYYNSCLTGTDEATYPPFPLP